MNIFLCWSQQATKLARSMVCRWGFSDEVGVVSVSKDDASPEQKALVDKEVQRLVTQSYARATKLLTDNRRDLDKIAAALIEHETLTGSEISDFVLKGKTLPKKLVTVKDIERQKPSTAKKNQMPLPTGTTANAK
jgi:ATP-dependent metalloprotease